MIIPSETTERIEAIQYIPSQNLIFLTSRDGKIQIWRLPQKWREEWVNKKESDFVTKRKWMAREKKELLRRQQEEE